MSTQNVVIGSLRSRGHFEIESAAAEITRPPQTSRPCNECLLQRGSKYSRSLKSWSAGNICTVLLLSTCLPVYARCRHIERSCSQSEAVGITQHRALKHKTRPRVEENRKVRRVGHCGNPGTMSTGSSHLPLPGQEDRQYSEKWLHQLWVISYQPAAS